MRQKKTPVLQKIYLSWPVLLVRQKKSLTQESLTKSPHSYSFRARIHTTNITWKNSDHQRWAKNVIKAALGCHYPVAGANANPFSLEKDSWNTGL